jgi:hypothetical protein
MAVLVSVGSYGRPQYGRPHERSHYRKDMTGHLFDLRQPFSYSERRYWVNDTVPARPASRRRDMSRVGALPKWRAYSRLNWDALT